jgi:hypothetical protein
MLPSLIQPNTRIGCDFAISTDVAESLIHPNTDIISRREFEGADSLYCLGIATASIIAMTMIAHTVPDMTRSLSGLRPIVATGSGVICAVVRGRRLAESIIAQYQIRL